MRVTHVDQAGHILEVWRTSTSITVFELTGKIKRPNEEGGTITVQFSPKELADFIRLLGVF